MNPRVTNHVHKPTVATATGRRALCTLLAAGLAASGALARPTGPTTDIVLTGRVRDFPSTHPDFCITPSVGGWVEGIASDTLNPQGRPTFANQGRRILVPATDGSGHTIATSLIEHTVLTPVSGLKLVNAINISNNPTVDSYNPAAGPYGGSNIGSAPQAMTGQAMPDITAPNITPVIGEYKKDGNATTTLNSSFRCSKFLISNQHKLIVQGNVTVVVDEEFKVENNSTITLAAGATLTIYAKKDATFQNHCSVNMNPQDHTRFVFYRLGTLDMFFQNNIDICGTFICPQGRLHLGNNCDVFGSFQSKDIHMQNSSGLHVAEPIQAGCQMLDDNPAQLGNTDSGKISSAASFGQWFSDVPGVNMDAQARLLFQKEPGGAYEFSSSDFRPIDGKLMDKGGSGANRNFTYEMDGEFTFQPCGGQFFEFSGDGDAFVYVDGKLALELAGHGTGVTQRVDMERLGLTPGETHRLQFFYASRSCDANGFTVRTNIELQTKYEVEIETTALVD